MIKGCQRRIIIVNDTGSPYFDSAYFVLKSDLPGSCADSDMIAEAHKLIDNCQKAPPAINAVKKRRRIFPWMIIGTAALLFSAALTITLIIL